ncbi:MAG: hypothetical protein ACTHLX_08070 [Candidatus Binatia bacterium]
MVTSILVNDTGENSQILDAKTKVRLYDNPSKVNERPDEFKSRSLVAYLPFTVYQQLAITL